MRPSTPYAPKQGNKHTLSPNLETFGGEGGGTQEPSQKTNLPQLISLKASASSAPSSKHRGRRNRPRRNRLRLNGPSSDSSCRHNRSRPGHSCRGRTHPGRGCRGRRGHNMLLFQLPRLGDIGVRASGMKQPDDSS